MVDSTGHRVRGTGGAASGGKRRHGMAAERSLQAQSRAGSGRRAHVHAIPGRVASESGKTCCRGSIIL